MMVHRPKSLERGIQFLGSLKRQQCRKMKQSKRLKRRRKEGNGCPSARAIQVIPSTKA